MKKQNLWESIVRNSFASWMQWIKARATWGDASGDGKTRDEALNQLAAKLNTSKDLMAETKPLVRADFMLIGRFIQIYCFSDLNARRIIDTVGFARTGQEAEFASKLNETDVLRHLKLCADPWIGPEHIGTGILRAAKTLEMHRIMRNSFAHWAMRRTANGEGYFMLTMHAGEVKRRGRDPNGSDEATFGIVLRKHVSEEMKKLTGHGKYLAKLAAHLNEHRAELRAMHSGADPDGAL